MESEKKKKSTAKKVLGIIGNVLIWLFIAFSVLITVFAFATKANDGVTPIGGKVISPVLSSSMEPTIKKGDLILTRKLSYDKAGKTFYWEKDMDKDDKEEVTLEVGDIISFKFDLNEDGQKNEVNTHRIAEVLVDSNGNVSYKTKGDNNLGEDSYTVLPSEVVSKYVDGVDKRIPVLGAIFSFLMQPTGFFVCIVIPLILFFLFEIVMFVRKIIEVKNSDKKQITAADEELIKQRAVEEYIRAQKEAEEKAAAENGETAPEDEPAQEPEPEIEPEVESGIAPEAEPESEPETETKPGSESE